jgi:ubiquinol oxidase
METRRTTGKGHKMQLLGEGITLRTGHRTPTSFGDRTAFATVKFLRWIADSFFGRRYGHRAVVLETVAAVPGMVGGALQHLKCLRRMEHDHGRIATLLDEAENERMHLMTFTEIARPTRFERWVVVLVQGIFFNFYFLTYLISPPVAHRIVGYMEEEAVISYSEYLREIDSGKIKNIPAPQIAIEYWNMTHDATLRDVIIAVRKDEMKHRDVNHALADESGKH